MTSHQAGLVAGVPVDGPSRDFLCFLAATCPFCGKANNINPQLWESLYMFIAFYAYFW